MSDTTSPDDCRITLGDAPGTDAFGLSLTINGVDMLGSAIADGPGLFRSRRRQDDPPFADGRLLTKGEIVGFLQRGVLVLPVLMPEDGWPLAFAEDGVRVEHGTSIVRYIRAMKVITP